MGKYILKRILLMIPVILGVVILVFTLMQLTPGDPAEVILGTTATSEQIEELRGELGLNDPYIVQLLRYMKEVFIQFDFGTSYISNVSISAELATRYPYTLVFAVAGMVLSLGIGIPLGVNAAVHQNSIADYGTMAIALIGTSLPGFLVCAGFDSVIFQQAWMVTGVWRWWHPILDHADHIYCICRNYDHGQADAFRNAGSHSFGLHYHGEIKGCEKEICYLQACTSKCTDSGYYCCKYELWNFSWRYLDRRNDFRDSRSWCVYCKCGK